jgi:hypothetical protein
VEYFIDMIQSSLPAAASGAESMQLSCISARTMANIRQGSRIALMFFGVWPPSRAESASAHEYDVIKPLRRYNSSFPTARHGLHSPDEKGQTKPIDPSGAEIPGRGGGETIIRLFKVLAECPVAELVHKGQSRRILAAKSP